MPIIGSSINTQADPEQYLWRAASKSVNDVTGELLQDNKLPYNLDHYKADRKNIAMSIFASGIIEPEMSIDYVKKFDGVDSILFGSSSRVNIERNIQLIQD